METGTVLIYSMIFGSVGIGYFIYGKRQSKIIPLLAGIALNLFPYFMPNIYAMVLVGLILIGNPWIYSG